MKQTPKRFSRRRQFLIIILFISMLVGIFASLYIKKRYAVTQPKECWMNVFIHGSFGTAIGLFSMFNVVKDKVDDTNYKKMTSHMRYDPFFYQQQPIMVPGMHQITPTFTPPEDENKLAVFPITAAYKALSELCNPASKHDLYYVFGWSGLVSQQRRRKEAIRFYNALTTEYEKLITQGITPKIRLITHSHGGNVVLNMAGVHDLLCNDGANTPTEQQYPDADHRETMQRIAELLAQTKPKDEAAKALYQKRLDYHPRCAPFTIDEVILLGTPVQPETTAFFFAPFFKKIFHLYSADDVVQGMDWVSTRRYFSEQRVPGSPTGTNAPTLIQARITVSKPQKQESSNSESTTTPETTTLGSLTHKITSVVSSLFSTQPTKDKPDPLHKELWFMSWKQKENVPSAQQHIKPLPFVVLVPLMQELFKLTPESKDVDLRLKFNTDRIDFMIYPHDEITKQKKISFPRNIITELQEKALSWQPKNIDAAHEMNILHRYSQMLSM